MPLNNEIISEFAKLAMNKKEVKPETEVQGTVVYNDKLYVKLDGSDLLTPVETTIDVADGDRVNVSIKDHTATITGSTSSPAAKQETVEKQGSKISDFEIIVAYKVTADNIDTINATVNTLLAKVANITELSAVAAEIETLRANLVDAEYLTASDIEAVTAEIDKLTADIIDATGITTDELNADYAEINNLKAYVGNFTYIIADELEAINANIKNLNTDNVIINEKLTANEADIKYLKANNADIGDLTADVAKLETLIFGTASGNVIHSDFSNAVIAQLGIAQIKSAMIESITADKILSGKIYTNNVEVQSEDGKLLISDETIQIRDDARVRVQIGKDASNDYSINVWDEDGNLMFSKGGITDSAIKESIIRNDMISDEANIDAGKLDIDSLFTEINGSTKTIKSSKVYLDKEGQTLDLAFTLMSTDLDDTKDIVESQGNRLSVVQGKIDSKVWQQDIDIATGEMSTKYSALEQTVNKFKTTVSETYTTKEDLSKLSVGGRNYILQSNTFAENGGTAAGITRTVENGVMKIVVESTNENWHSWWMGTTIEENFKTGDEFTFSIDIKCDEGSIGKPGIYFKPNMGYYPMTGDVGTEWSTLYYSGVWKDDYDLAFHFGWGEASGTFYIRRVKFERGNKVTDWTPAPEDIEDKVATVNTKIEQTSGKIELTAQKLEEDYYTKTQTDAAIKLESNSIKLGVSETYTTKDAFNNLEVGGRNLLRNTEEPITTTSPTDYEYQYLTFTPTATLDETKQYTISANVEILAGEISEISVKLYSEDIQIQYAEVRVPITNGRIVGTFEAVNSAATKLLLYAGVAGSTAGNSVTFSKIKFEKGNKATDWTPAPEDVAEDISIVEGTANEAAFKITQTEADIEILSSCISSLVRDENGQSLMEQTAEGWHFSTTEIQNAINDASEALGDLTEKLGSTDAIVSVLNKAVSDIGEKTRYVNIGTYSYTNDEGAEVTEPCIELGESENDYKVLITNTQILFKVGSAAPTCINTDGLITENITVENEFKQTNKSADKKGFWVWAVRANGNYGLQWKGAIE